MPTIGIFHTFYWENSVNLPPPVLRVPGGYPLWQTSAVTLGCGVGGLLPFWERCVDQIRWAWFLVRQTWRYDQERRAIVRRAIEALDHAAFPCAQAAVRQTATTIGFNRPQAWLGLSRAIKSDAGQAENLFRHLEACRLVRLTPAGTALTNPQRALLVELSYHGMAAKADRAPATPGIIRTMR